jgi:hypothetical protein
MWLIVEMRKAESMMILPLRFGHLEGGFNNIPAACYRDIIEASR